MKIFYGGTIRRLRISMSFPKECHFVTFFLRFYILLYEEMKISYGGMIRRIKKNKTEYERGINLL